SADALSGGARDALRGGARGAGRSEDRHSNASWISAPPRTPHPGSRIPTLAIFPRCAKIARPVPGSAQWKRTATLRDMMMLPSTTEMYRALVERDQSFEGLFFACVRTTGIFCRPTCRARKPKPENVEFAATIQDALHRGYR